MHFILNELVMGGMVLETNMTEILLRIEEQNKIAKEEVRSSTQRIYVFLSIDISKSYTAQNSFYDLLH